MEALTEELATERAPFRHWQRRSQIIQLQSANQPEAFAGDMERAIATACSSNFTASSVWSA